MLLVGLAQTHNFPFSLIYYGKFAVDLGVFNLRNGFSEMHLLHKSKIDCTA
jgi:hypothetical protein